MRTFKIILYFLILFQVSLNAQNVKGIFGNDNWMGYWSNFHPQDNRYNETNEVLSGIITKDQKLTKRNTYLLMGTVYVTENAILTIEPGTVIRGDEESCGTLVITKGAKIIAEGTVTDPIVFTSNKNDIECKPGDWGGIILLGNAPINHYGGISKLDFDLDNRYSQYGGENEKSNSGILKYIRIEYAGRKINTTKELNGLSLAGVGSDTKLDKIQISYSNDDSFECYGGNVIFSNIISYRATDDDFDFTQGSQCNITNSVAFRNPYSSDISKSRCFEIDSYDVKENTDFAKKMTHINATNITMTNTDFSEQGMINEAISIHENCYLNLTNSVISGFESLICLAQNIKPIQNDLNKIKVQNILINSSYDVIVSENKDYNADIKNWYTPTTYSLEIKKETNKDLFNEFNTKKEVDLRLKNNSTVVSSN